jgi:hypothetical protein
MEMDIGLEMRVGMGIMTEMEMMNIPMTCYKRI